MKFTLTLTQSRIIKLLSEKGYKTYVVGGAIRDKLLGKEPNDLDFAHNAPLPFLKSSPEHYIVDDSAEQHGIIRFIDQDKNSSSRLIDFARLRRDTTTDGRHATVEYTDDIKEDLARRDFTINAMACEVDAEGQCSEIIDPFGGQRDVADHRISFVGDPTSRIREDYLRILRACRFSALGPEWKIDPGAHLSAAKNVKGILSISKERIRDELLKGLSYSKPSNMFNNMLAMDLLTYIFPDLEKGVGCTQNKYHAETVYNHLLRCLDASVGLTNNPLLRLATLCHDIAKPHTKKIINDDATFHSHEVIGASIVYRWMRDLRFPKADCEYVSKMVRHHQWRFEKNTTDKTIRHWLHEVGRMEWRDLITLRMADRKGNLKNEGKPLITHEMKELISRVENMIDNGVPLFREDLAITGEDLKLIGIPPGPVYKEIFENLLGIVITDPEKNNKEWMKEWSLNHVSKKKAKEDKPQG